MGLGRELLLLTLLLPLDCLKLSRDLDLALLLAMELPTELVLCFCLANFLSPSLKAASLNKVELDSSSGPLWEGVSSTKVDLVSLTATFDLLLFKLDLERLLDLVPRNPPPPRPLDWDLPRLRALGLVSVLSLSGSFDGDSS